MSDLYEKLSAERKQAQADGKFPEWTTTGSYQMFKDKYEYHCDGLREQQTRIAKTLANHAVPFIGKDHPFYRRIVENHGNNWEDCFFSIMWKNDFQPSTPVLANTGTNRGMSVSCSGGLVNDSVEGFYDSNAEAAILSKMGFGTSYYLGDVRARGTKISSGGIADGTDLPKSLLTETAKRISQSGVRRGSVACYLPVDHEDFEEWVADLQKNPQGQNIGWNYSQKEIDELKQFIDSPDDSEAHKRLAKVLKTRMNRGKGYIWKPETVNRLAPDWYKWYGWSNKASNLCTEITLHSDELHTYTCIISSMVGTGYNRWKDTGSAFIATIFLDALCNEFIAKAEGVKGLEKALRYTKKAKSLGLGLLGLASYFQDEMIPFDSIEARLKNIEIFKHLQTESIMASEYVYECGGGAQMMVEYAEAHPEWKPRAHSHLMCCAPNVSSAVLAGQTSNGIEPYLANIFMQPTSAGELRRINPLLLKLMKERGMYKPEVITRIIDNKGSVQKESWLSDLEKRVLLTAFEIPQEVLVKLCSERQRFMDQGQSLNLFFDSETDPDYIKTIHLMVLLDEYINGAYYCRSESGVSAAKNSEECTDCAS